MSHEEARISAPEQTQAVTEVIPGEVWSDYRPARPSDFVGRSTLIHEIEDFFSAVANGSSKTRVFGIKSNSGWGKSSLALKLAETFAKKRVSVLAVDCRAASSSFYPDLAVGKALAKAAQDVLPGPLFAPQADFRKNPFEEPSVRAFLADMARVGGLICIIFDQFEAIIHRAELKPVFDRLREIALFADELGGPVVIGFSWKTDGTVASDNPGYHVWHSLSDRRRDFVVDRFTRVDADDFIALALKGANTRLPGHILQYIRQNYAGYPWLLKKLLKHFTDQVNVTGVTTTSASAINISSLFDGDIQELSPEDLAALKFVSREAPVEFHIVEERFGQSSIQSLFDRRLIIKTGSQLSPYWDVFREYVLTGSIPIIPNTYVPTVSVRRIRSVIRILIDRSTTTYDGLAKKLGISVNTADNIVRDLDNMGLVNAERYVSRFESACVDPYAATAKIAEFLKSHIIFRRAKEIIEAEGRATLKEVEDAVAPDYSFISIDKSTRKTYVRKILVYCLDVGLLARAGSGFILDKQMPNLLESTRKPPTLSDDEVFRGAASPTRVVELLRALSEGRCGTLHAAAQEKLRNAVYAASSLGLVDHRAGRVTPTEATLRANDLEELVASSARQVEPLRTLFSEEADLERMTAEEVGITLSDMLELNWSLASCRRYGFSIKEWISWVGSIEERSKA